MAMRFPIPAVILFCASAALAQNSAPTTTGPTATKTFVLAAGQHLPLSLVQGVSTRNGAPGDPVYLVTTFPVMSENRIVIPVGSYVTGTLTESKRAGKVKGRAELRMRIETIILPNGVTHDFRGNPDGVQSSNGETLDKEGTVRGRGGKGSDLRTIGMVTGAGAMVGGAAGGFATIGQTSVNTGNANNSYYYNFRRPIIGSAIGVAAGAAAGLTAILLTRGPDVVLAKGTDLDMMLDRSVTFEEVDLAGFPVPPSAHQ